MFKRENTTRYHIKNKKVFEFFKKLGMPVGKKKNQVMKIPAELIQSRQLTKSFIRGVWGADGTMYRRYSKKYANHKKIYLYINLQLKMKAPVLINQIDKFLREEGIKTNRITEDRKKNAVVLRITHQKAVQRFVEIIGFSNPRYAKKFKDLSTEPKARGS